MHKKRAGRVARLFRTDRERLSAVQVSEIGFLGRALSIKGRIVEVYVLSQVQVDSAVQSVQAHSRDDALVRSRLILG